MKYKIIILLISTLFIFCGCNKQDTKLPDDILKARENLINNMGKTNDSQIIIKYSNNHGETCYYVYKLGENDYIEYQYILHKSEESFKETIERYRVQTYYSLATFEDALVTKIKLKQTTLTTDTRDIIIDKYKNNKNYEIIS